MIWRIPPRSWRARLVDVGLFDCREAAAALLDSRWAMAGAAALIVLIWLLLDATT